IIIISRDSHILINHGVNEVYNAQLVNVNKSLQLLCRKAFKSVDNVKHYEKLIYDVLKYVNSLLLWRKENPSIDIMNWIGGGNSKEIFRLLWNYLNIEAKNLETILKHYRDEFLETTMRVNVL
ncbi:hypothetical protein CR513_49826, partial [Mucuna pruriens]